MGEWLGALGGLGMIALVAALLIRFLRDMGVSIPADAPRTMAAAAAVMLIEMLIAGLNHHMRMSFWLPEMWPFSGYVALAMGAWTAWSVRRLLGERWMALFLAVPGAVLLFLPTWASPAAFAAALALRLARKGREWRAPQPPYPLYLALLCVLATLSGLFVILFPGGGAA